MRFLSIWVLLVPATAFGQQESKVVDLSGLQRLMKAPSEQIQVFNFWATWCAPCIKELPLLEALNESRPDVHVTLVSLDLDLDPNPGKVNRFVSRKGIQSEVLLLDAPDPNSWIEKIDKSWSGALPATIIINGKSGERKFIGRELQAGELERTIGELIR